MIVSLLPQWCPVVGATEAQRGRPDPRGHVLSLKRKSVRGQLDIGERFDLFIYPPPLTSRLFTTKMPVFRKPSVLSNISFERLLTPFRRHMSGEENRTVW